METVLSLSPKRLRARRGSPGVSSFPDSSLLQRWVPPPRLCPPLAPCTPSPAAALGATPTPLLPACSLHTLTRCSQWPTWSTVPPPSPQCMRTEAGSRLRASFAVCGMDPGSLLALQPPFNNGAFEEAFLFGGFPHISVGKDSTCNGGDPGSIPGLERSPGEGIGYPLQYSWASLIAQLVNNLPAM